MIQAPSRAPDPPLALRLSLASAGRAARRSRRLGWIVTGFLVAACATPSGSLAPISSGAQTPAAIPSGTSPNPTPAVPTPSPAPISTAGPSPCLGASSLSGVPDPSLGPAETRASPGTAGSPAPTRPEPGLTFHVPILTYHVIAPRAVAAPYALAGLDVSPELFDAQLQSLRRAGWHSITVAQLASDVSTAIAPSPKTFVITIDDGHADGATYALPILQRYGFVATFYVVAGRIGDPTDLTWAQIGELSGAGMEIGNHTLEHVHLTTLSAADLKAEIDGAQTILATRLCRAPTTFAYPFGDFNSAVVAVARDAGFRMAVTTVHGAEESWVRRLEVPRISVYSSLTADELLVKMDPYR